MGPGHKAMPIGFNFSLSLVKPCDLHVGSHVVECSAPGGEKIDGLCMTSCDWPISSLSISLRNCAIDKVSLSIAMAFHH